MATSNDNVWILVPAYNEGRRLAKTLSSLLGTFPNIVVVDDGSRDDTAKIARQWPVWVLRHAINRGQGAALETALRFALLCGAETIVTFDADGQHSAENIAGMIRVLHEKQVDVVLGSRFLGTTEGMPTSRWLILKLGVLFTRVTSQIRVTDTHNGLRVLSRHAAEQIHISMDRMEHASEILDEIRRKNLTFCEHPVNIRYTADTMEKGQSSLNGLRIVAKLLLSKVLR